MNKKKTPNLTSVYEYNQMIVHTLLGYKAGQSSAESSRKVF